MTTVGERRAALAAGEARGANRREEKREDRGRASHGVDQRLQGERVARLAKALEPEDGLGDERGGCDDPPAARGGRGATRGVDEPRRRRAPGGEAAGEAVAHHGGQPVEDPVADVARLGARPSVGCCRYGVCTLRPRPHRLRPLSYSPPTAIAAIGPPVISICRPSAVLRATSPRHSISFFIVNVTSESATRIEATLNAAAK